MNLSLILFECERRRVTLELDGENIRVRGGRHRVTPDLLALIRDRKADLLAHFTPLPAHSLAHSTDQSAPAKCARAESLTPSEERSSVFNGEGGGENGALGASKGECTSRIGNYSAIGQTGAMTPPFETSAEIACISGPPVYPQKSAPSAPSAPERFGSRRRSPWPELSTGRWYGDPTFPGIDIPPDWRDRVAALPHAGWVAWRRRSGELQQALGHPPTADEIGEADRASAAEMGVLDTRTNSPRSPRCLIQPQEDASNGRRSPDLVRQVRRPDL